MRSKYEIATKQKGATDEWLTREVAVYPIIPYIKSDSIIWCPFDLEDSAYVKVLQLQFQVVFSHIEQGKDFFDYEPPVWDCIISNPPFSKRNEVFERCFDLGKPFALLQNYAGLWDNRIRYELFKKHGIELLILKGRERFIRRENGFEGSPLFQSIYVCHNMLPKEIMYV